jgi:hypothetical protein
MNRLTIAIGLASVFVGVSLAQDSTTNKGKSHQNEQEDSPKNLVDEPQLAIILKNNNKRIAVILVSLDSKELHYKLKPTDPKSRTFTVKDIKAVQIASGKIFAVNPKSKAFEPYYLPTDPAPAKGPSPNNTPAKAPAPKVQAQVAGNTEDKKQKEEPAEGVREITADFLPHRPGTTRCWDSQLNLPNGTASVFRAVSILKEGGAIERSTSLKVGGLRAGQSILKGDNVEWLLEQPRPANQPDYQRVNGRYVEMNKWFEGRKQVEWEPVLKIGAREGDTWKWNSYTGLRHEYTVKAFSTHEGKAMVVVVATSGPVVKPMTQTVKYVRGVGKVESITFQEGKQTAVGKLVEESDTQNEEPSDGTFRFAGQLTKDDPADPVRAKSVHRVHSVTLKGGKTYTIDMLSGYFDSYLRLEDSSRTVLAEDDDSGGGLNARIVFRAPKTDTYRIIATSYDGGTGKYALNIKEGATALVKPAAVAKEAAPKNREPIPGSRKLDARRGTISKDVLDRDCTNRLSSLAVSVNSNQITLEFDVSRRGTIDACIGGGGPVSLVVRLFDKDGRYLTHFVTQENFTDHPKLQGGWTKTVLLEQKDNRLVYNVDPAFLRVAAIVEVGFLRVQD